MEKGELAHCWSAPDLITITSFFERPTLLSTVLPTLSEVEVESNQIERISNGFLSNFSNYFSPIESIES